MFESILESPELMQTPGVVLTLIGYGELAIPVELVDKVAKRVSLDYKVRTSASHFVQQNHCRPKSKPCQQQRSFLERIRNLSETAEGRPPCMDTPRTQAGVTCHKQSGDAPTTTSFLRP